ncbi:unnamed protein product [Clonostachys byssicola]|uniref:C2H2-type domain-containing protein n=1 Tax=Clonostachys byssicola TaxID=160290 RepID=A0A9N9Y240_9HYPO|nr:unnamed protein product [Clonostachys byssicola]
MDWACCSRCDRYFNSPLAMEQHIRDSPKHNICGACNDDFELREDLEEHCEYWHDYCRHCSRFFDSAEDLDQHDVLQHDMCIVCGRYFISENNLRYHKLTHVDKTIGCRGCERDFVTHFAMTLHLEEGTCSSGVDQGRVTELAFQCRLSQYYASSKGGFDFECPSCTVPFSYMSGLFQHVQSEACDEELDKHSPLRVFLRFLRRRA